MNAKEHIKKASLLMANIPDDYRAIHVNTREAIDTAVNAARTHAMIAMVKLENPEVDE